MESLRHLRQASFTRPVHGAPLLLAGLCTFLMVACNSNPSPPESVRTANFDTCTGFFDLEEVRKLAGRTDITLADPNVNSGPQVPSSSGIEALCVIEYVTPAKVIGGPTSLQVKGRRWP